MEARRAEAEQLIRRIEREIRQQTFWDESFDKLLSHTLQRSTQQIRGSHIFETAIVLHAWKTLDPDAKICTSQTDEKVLARSITAKADYNLILPRDGLNWQLEVSYDHAALSAKQIGEIATVYETYYGLSIIQDVFHQESSSKIYFDLAEFVAGPMRVMNGQPKPAPQEHLGFISATLEDGDKLPSEKNRFVEQAIQTYFNDTKKCHPTSPMSKYIWFDRSVRWTPEYAGFNAAIEAYPPSQIRRPPSIAHTPQTTFSAARVPAVAPPEPPTNSEKTESGCFGCFRGFRRK